MYVTHNPLLPLYDSLIQSYHVAAAILLRFDQTLTRSDHGAKLKTNKIS